MNKLAIKIISGGQTGADRAALDWARRWCLAEDEVLHFASLRQDDN
ncbi:MAG: hypothetical protein NT167_04035 [Verrucomicrobia bacterium]|nr:hypothetical protein [Verrucomicrobiota bacterium]